MRSNHSCWVRIANVRINLSNLSYFKWTQEQDSKTYIFEFKYLNIDNTKTISIPISSLNHKDFVRIKNKIDELMDVINLNAENVNYF